MDYFKSDFSVDHYVARQSWISVGTDTSHIFNRLRPIPSNFQERMVRGDLTGNALQELSDRGNETDLVVIDLIDERNGVLDFGEARYATRLAEFWTAGGSELAEEAEYIPFGSDRHFHLWSHRAQAIIEWLANLELIHKTVVIKTPWATIDDDGDPINWPSWMPAPELANQQYERYFGVLEDLGMNFVSLNPELAVSSKTHKWGTSPFHYCDAAYQAIGNELRKLASDLRPDPPLES